MAIRFATLADVPALVEGGSRMHALTRFRNQPFSAQKVAQAFTDLITQGQGKYAFLVATGSGEQVVGALVGVMEKQIFSECFTASVMHFDVLPEARMGGHGVRLLKAFEQWARNSGALEVVFGINSGVDTERLAQFVVKMGYEGIGTNHAKQLVG